MNSHTPSRHSYQRPTPLPPTHQVPRAVHGSQTTHRESPITNHDLQLAPHSSRTRYNYALPFLINGATIKIGCNSQKTNNGGRF